MDGQPDQLQGTQTSSSCDPGVGKVQEETREKIEALWVLPPGQRSVGLMNGWTKQLQYKAVGGENCSGSC